MPDDPFAGMTDTFQDRKERGIRARKEIRKQLLRAFAVSVGATILVVVATGAGGASGGWIFEQGAGRVLDRFLGGIICGLAGGVFFFCFALWRVMRRLIVDEVLGNAEEVDIGATLFWATIVGAILFGSVGAALGLAGSGWRNDVLACAIAAGVLSLIPAILLKNTARRTSRTRSGSAAFRKRD